MKSKEIKEKLEILSKEKDVNFVILVTKQNNRKGMADIYTNGFEFFTIQGEYFQIILDNRTTLYIDIHDFVSINTKSKMVMIHY